VSRERILVVDDSAEVRDFLANTVLKLEGYTVDTARDGKEGLEATLADPPDLVISDQAMPKLTGLAMIREIRQAGLRTPIILMTAEGSEEIASQALRAGVSFYFIKPFDPIELQEAVSSILRPAPSAEAVAAAALAEAEHGLTGEQAIQILRSMQDAVIAVDGDGRIFFCNPAAAHLLPGAGSDSPIGKTISQVATNRTLIDLFETKGRLPDEVDLQLDDGSTFTVSANMIPRVGRVAALHNTTALHEINRKKSEFTLTVAHDLRSPLTAILSYIELIERAGNLNEQQATFTRELREGVSRITNLINDLLELSRIEAGMDVHNEPVQLQQVAENVIDALRGRAELKHQRLHRAFARRHLRVMANPVRLRQVFANLIDNAIKYTPDSGEIKVTLTAEGGQVMCSISDTGIGVPVEAQAHIFDKFYRAENIAGSYDGTGLGLSIVKSIVESYDGRIWVDSAPGKGSTFTVVLPAYPPEPA
jgi:signal transduction histidine kinase